MPESIGLIISVMVAAAVGSFLNVVIYRLPAGLSIVSPGSRCPNCLTPIKPYHNIPVISWLLLGGKCAHCRVQIPVRYLLVEALTGALGGALWLKFGLTAELPIFFVFVAGLIVIAFIDIDHHLIFDVTSYGGMAVGLAASFFTPLGWQGSLMGIAAGVGSLLIVVVTYKLITGKEGMGMGDPLLLGAIGAFLGWVAIPFTIFVSSVVGSVVGIIWLKLNKADKSQPIPYGPFLALGAVVYLFFGPRIIGWYLNI